MSSLKFRSLLAALFALPGFTLGMTLGRPAAGPDPAPAPIQVAYAGPETCRNCHSEHYDAWKDSPHARASADEPFQQEWKSAGSQAYCLSCHTTGYDPNTGKFAQAGITCENCHGPMEPSHPARPMQVRPKSEACAGCHVETMREWKLSGHARADIGCTACHNVHSPGLKADNSTLLCAVCHSARAQDFSHAPHAYANLACADCHIGPASGPLAEGRRLTGHTFVVNTVVCADCHKDQIHRSASFEATASPPTTGQADETTDQMGLAPAPRPVSPVGYALLAAVAGLGVGVVLAPWLEKFLRGPAGRPWEE